MRQSLKHLKHVRVVRTQMIIINSLSRIYTEFNCRLYYVFITSCKVKQQMQFFLMLRFLIIFLIVFKHNAYIVYIPRANRRE